MPSAAKGVIEYGMWVDRGTTGQVRAWRSLGAQAWWFDGDRVAALQAWKQENEEKRRPYPDDLWHRVVGEIDRNWSLVEQCFGHDRILRTIEHGPTLVPEEEVYATMWRVIDEAADRSLPYRLQPNRDPGANNLGAEVKIAKHRLHRVRRGLRMCRRSDDHPSNGNAILLPPVP